MIKEKVIFNFLNSLDLDRYGLELVKKYFLLGNYCLALEELFIHLKKREKPVFFWNWKNKDDIISIVNHRYPDERDKEIEYANQILKHSFTFQHRWDMEQSFIPYNLGKGIDWVTAMPNGDMEWNAMLNRHRYWIDLGRAYWYTSNEIYVREWIYQLLDFIKKTKSHPLETWSDLQVGIRVREWIKTYYYMLNSPNFDSFAHFQFLDSLREHAEHLFKRLKYYQGNRAFFVLSGLATTALLFPEFKDSAIWALSADENLISLIKEEILPDGNLRELVPLYHNEVVMCLFEYLHLARLNNKTLPTELFQVLENMIQANVYLAQPDGKIPTVGDSDEFDVRDWLTAGALFFERGDFKFRGYKNLDYSNFWYFGKNGIYKYDSIKVDTPKSTSYLFNNSNWGIMRGDWSESAHYLFFDCSDLEKKSVNATHSHADNLQIIVHAHGKLLLVDPGRYIYSDIYCKILNFFRKKYILLYGIRMRIVYYLLFLFKRNSFELNQRRYFKVTSAHNTIVIDKKDQSIYLNEARWVRMANCILKEWISLPNLDYAEGSHDGYRRLKQPITHTRKVVFIKKEYWIIIDILNGNGCHRFDLYFHLDCDEDELCLESGIASTKNDTSPGIRIIPLGNKDMTVSKICGWVSKYYNTKKMSPVIEYTKFSSAPTSFYSLIFPLNTGDKPLVQASLTLVKEGTRELKPEEAALIEIKINKRRDYFLISHDFCCARKFGPFEFDGKLCFVQMNEKEMVEKVVLIGGRSFLHNGDTLIKSKDIIENLDIEIKENKPIIFSSQKIKINLPKSKIISLERCQNEEPLKLDDFVK